MEILIVLFATRIVLNSFSGLLYIFMAACVCLLLSDFSFSISSGRNEKNATSDPDISADPNNSIKRIIIPMIIPVSGAFNAISGTSIKYESGYSGSN